jgi:hypothetical protein
MHHQSDTIAETLLLESLSAAIAQLKVLNNDIVTQ